MSFFTIPKIIIFGAGIQGQRFLQEYGDKIEIVAFVDNLKEGVHCGHKIIPPNRIASYNYDRIIIAIDDMSENGCSNMNAIIEQLKKLGIHENKILISDCRYSLNDPRVDFIKRYSKIIENYDGAVAEAGVYRGHFSFYMSLFFPYRKFFLFDTFEGFPDNDVDVTVNNHNKLLVEKTDVYDYMCRRGNDQIALYRCINRDSVYICKGCIPQTFDGKDNERFIFVNIDVDLYKPTLESLLFFLPRMERQGVILVHDYYNYQFSEGIKQAICEASVKYSFTQLPIGDHASIALVSIIPNLEGKQ